MIHLPKHKQMISNNHEQMKNSIGGANLEVFKFTLVLHLISFLPIHYLLQIQLRNDSASFWYGFIAKCAKSLGREQIKP